MLVEGRERKQLEGGGKGGTREGGGGDEEGSYLFNTLFIYRRQIGTKHLVMYLVVSFGKLSDSDNKY